MLAPRARLGLRERVGGEHLEDDRHAGVARDLRDAARGLVRDEVEVRGLAADHGAEADDRVVAAARRQAPRHERDLERARHPRHVDGVLGDAVRGEPRQRALGELAR